MGVHDVGHLEDDRELRLFMRALLEDVQALELMIDRGMLEMETRHVGAEQEMFLIDGAGRPAPVNGAVLATLGDEAFTTELAKFNMEANVPALPFGGDCLRRLEGSVAELVQRARQAAAGAGARILLIGILPSIQVTDLGLDNMTPNPRYYALNESLLRLRQGRFATMIKGVDGLNLTHDNVMLEACNTSFQVHFQVGPEEFAKLYNTAQLVTAPVLAAATNSPLLLGKRLWHETRIALFEQSIDARSTTHQARGQRKRVRFGDAWLRGSVLDLYREDIARMRVVLSTGVEEDSVRMVKEGTAPPLSALCLFNSTVYRWNRPCYGVDSRGVPHLRIENRALPSGPTVADEIANAAFYFGLMSGLLEEIGDPADALPFDVPKRNFLAAAQLGIDAQLTWLDHQVLPAAELILERLLPIARRGLDVAGIDEADRDRFLGILQRRVERRRTGSRWQLISLARLERSRSHDEALRSLVNVTHDRQLSDVPVHEWSAAAPSEASGWQDSYQRVGQFMTTDLVTLRPGDLVDLAAALMDWQHIRHVPVEDDEGHLVGLVTYRALLKLLVRGLSDHNRDPVSVASIMRPNPITVTPETKTLEAIRIMRENRVGCLPVIHEGKLAGIITEHDLVKVAGLLLERHLEERDSERP